MLSQNVEKATKRGRSNPESSANAGHQSLNIAIVARHQTAQEQHRFQAAVDALLTELVRQQLHRRSK